MAPLTCPGVNTPAQIRIQSLLNELVASGNDRGLQCAVYHRGKLIVDCWAGTLSADPAPGHPAAEKVTADTLFPVFSTGKGFEATIVHMLVERGVLDYEKPIAYYWPEFAAHDKQNITLRHVLTHTAGLSHMPPLDDVTELFDWPDMCRRVADLTPLWPAGKQIAYHAITYAWLVGEPCCRATGRTFSQLVKDLIADPLGISNDLFFGITDAQQARVATLESPAPSKPVDPEDPAIPNVVRPLEDLMNNHAVQRSCCPASTGIMNARAIARHYASLLPGGVDGIELLSPETIERATTLNRIEDVPIEHMSHHFGLGYGLKGPHTDISACFGHGGYGGAAGYADQRNHLAVGVTKNTMGAPRSAAELVRAVLLETLGR